MNTGIMTDTLTSILAVLENGASTLTGGAAGVLFVLAAIEFAWMGILHALGAGDIFQSLVRKVIHVGMYVFIVTNFASLANTITEGFLWAGAQVGGGGVSMDVMRNPSAILMRGMFATAEIWESIDSVSIMDGGIVSALIMAVVGLAIMMLFFVIALQVFIALVEFHVILGFGVIFIPWGVNKHTSWITEKYLGAVVSQGVKLMVLATLIGIVMPVINKLQLPAEPTFSGAMGMLFGVGTMAYLVSRAPAVASGLMSGAASLSAGDAAGSAMQAGSTIANVAAAGASGGASAVSAGAKLASKVKG